MLLPLDIRPTGHRQPAGRAARSSCTRPARAAAGPAGARPTRSTATSTRSGCGSPRACPPRRASEPLEEILALPDLRHWLPSERLVAGSDSGNFVFDQRIVTKALRDIGPLAFLADGEPFAGCLFHEMVIRDGRKMSKHLGNVVDPDELVERYGADTVRLAVLYAARPQRSLNWSDSAVLRCHRFLTQVWEYSQREARRRAAAARARSRERRGRRATGAEQDKTEHLRVKLVEWCENGVERITEDMESLEMHSAVRNVMRLFDRIKDFEKRVLARQARARPRPTARRCSRRSRVLAQVLGPLAPHLAEELWIALGHEEHAAQTPWPGVSLRVPA